MTDRMREVELIGGSSDEDGGAFDREAMQKMGVDNYALSQALAKSLMPFAALLRKNHGFAVVDREGRASVIGLDVEGAPND